MWLWGAGCGSGVLNPFRGSSWGSVPSPARRFPGQGGRPRGGHRVREPQVARPAAGTDARGARGPCGRCYPVRAPHPGTPVPHPEPPFPITCPGSRSGAGRGRGRAVAPRDVTGGTARATSGGDVSAQKGAESWAEGVAIGWGVTGAWSRRGLMVGVVGYGAWFGRGVRSTAGGEILGNFGEFCLLRAPSLLSPWM